MAVMLSTEKQASVDIFSEVEKTELEHEVAFAATRFWVRSCWADQWANDMYAAGMQ